MGERSMSFKPFTLVPVFVLGAVVVDRPAYAQFGVAGGLVAPTAFPSPYLNYGGAGFASGLGSGAGLGYGLGYSGYGTQWMQNPYAGYLNGAANLTTANANYQSTIQQARLAREEARRSALQTHHQAILERQWERSLIPDPEQVRQKQMQRSLERSRNNPPPTDIWSGTALNDLLRAIQTSQTDGTNGPEVPLAPEVLKHINLTTGKTTGGIGLLRGDGKLSWPFVLRQGMFQEPRKQLDQLLPQAVKQARSGQVDADLVNQINASVKELEQAVDAGASSDLTPDQYIAASRYLRELKASTRILQQDDVAKYFRSEWTPQGATVADLVKQMTKQGLKFAPAVSGDESYYTALHRALVDYDKGQTQLTTTGLNP
jgi:hypothetical protein